MVSINKVSSSEPIKFGVPQGSMLGPLMFLTFINDLPLVLENVIISTVLYTDDTTVYDIQTYMQTLERNLQNSLRFLNKWCRKHSMVINTDKAKVMLITSRQKRYNLRNRDLSLNFKDADLKLTSNERV